MLAILKGARSKMEAFLLVLAVLALTAVPVLADITLTETVDTSWASEGVNDAIKFYNQFVAILGVVIMVFLGFVLMDRVIGWVKQAR